MDNALGNRLEKIRKTQRLTIPEFMELMGVTKSSYFNWRNGKNTPNVEYLVRVLEKYPQYSTEWLVLGIGEMYRNENTMQVGESSPNYGVDKLQNQVNELSKKVEELTQILGCKNSIIQDQGEKISEQYYALSPQERHKKDSGNK